MVNWLRKNDTRLVIAMRILLPVDEMLCGLNLKRIAEDRRTRMWRGAQAHNLRAKFNFPVVGLDRLVKQRDMNTHG